MTKHRQSTHKATAPADKAVPRRGGAAQSIGVLLPMVGGMAFRRFGFMHAELVSRWGDIVGAQFAAWSLPESIRFARGQKNNGTLSIRVEGPFALQMQHLGPQIIERVNRVFGHAAVARIKLVHGPVPRQPQRTLPVSPPVPVSVTPGGANLRAIGDEKLRLALEDLARQLGNSSGPPRIG